MRSVTNKHSRKALNNSNRENCITNKKFAKPFKNFVIKIPSKL